MLTGQIDVGFVRTDQLERFTDRRTGELLDLSLIKVIQPQTNVVMSNGDVFPFPMSTSVLYPEWPLAAMPHVDRQLVSAVQAGLLNMKTAAQASDTSGSLANEAFSSGRFAGWSPALSYLELRNLQRELGIIDEKNHCISGTEIKDVIVCKPGYYPRDDEVLFGQCAVEGLDCYGFECICQPCVARPPVEFAPLDRTGESCSKFDVCGVVEQGSKIHFQLKDNLQRKGAAVWIEIFFDKESELVELARFPDESFRYEFVFDTSGREVDVAILDIYLNGAQIDLSPVRLDIVERDCIAATGDSRRIPDTVGNCVCDSTSVEFGHSLCIPNGVVAAMAIVPIVLILALFARRYIREKHLEARFWLIGKQELHFDETPRVLGRGSFGCVLEATYRGTNVAVKHTMPESQRNGSVSGIQGTSNSGMLTSESPTTLAGGLEVSRSSSDGLASALVGSFSRRVFREEMQKMAKLRHPCITTLIGAVFERSLEPILVMELMEWGSLYDLLRNDTLVIDPETVLGILLDVISGIQFLHSAKPVILHKDLKSTNVLVDAKFRAKISDFGFSQKENHVGALGVEAVRSLAYMAPELLRRKSSYTTASDVYAFGIIMTEVLSRKSPYEDESLNDIVSEIIDPEVNRRPCIPNDAAPSVVRLIKDCLAADPSTRPTATAIDVRLKVFRSELEELGLSVPKPKAEGQSQALLYQIFPRHIADDLRRGKKPEPERFDMVTGLFSLMLLN